MKKIMIKFNCCKFIEENKSEFSCCEQCEKCKTYFKPINEFDYIDYKKIDKAFEEILNEHSKFMMHPILWKRYFKEKHNLQKSTE